MSNRFVVVFKIRLKRLFCRLFDGFEDDLLKMKKMRAMLEESNTDLRLELALIVDVGTNVVKLCYHQEGDGFLTPTSYDHWSSVMDEISNIAAVNRSVVGKLHYLPLTDQLARELIPNKKGQEK